MRRLLYTFIIFVSAFLTAMACRDRHPQPRNLLLISIDTLRADHLGCYGYSRNTSPRIDQIAASGVLFTDVTASSPWTLPSHASILTGLYPSRHGVKNLENRLSDKIPTLATRLASEGYRTLGIVNSHHLSTSNGLNQGFESFEYVSEWSARDFRDRRTVNRGESISNQAIEWLRRDDGRPFFLFLHYFDVHSDYNPRPQYQKLFVRPYRGNITGQTRQLVNLRAGKEKLSEADCRYLTDLYDGEIRQLDDALSRLIHFLHQSGLDEETLIVFTADHGEEFMEHGSILHGRTYYQEVIAVPLIFSGPAIPEGVRCDEPVSLVDVAPTILERLGFSVSDEMDGMDLSIYWQPGDGKTAPAQRFIFSEADWMNEKPDMKRMVRKGNFKLCLDRYSGETECFDLERDPRESRDLGQSGPERRSACLAALEAFMAREKKGEHVAMPEGETLDQLRQLGYAE